VIIKHYWRLLNDFGIRNLKILLWYKAMDLIRKDVDDELGGPSVAVKPDVLQPYMGAATKMRTAI
jgi:hypothetical protein